MGRHHQSEGPKSQGVRSNLSAIAGIVDASDYNNLDHLRRRTEGDNPTLGLILCADKNDAVVKYTLGPEQEKKIFASRYKLHLPTEAELKAEIRRELRMIRSAGDKA